MNGNQTTGEEVDLPRFFVPITVVGGISTAQGA